MRRGVTLVELVIVLALLGMVLSMSALNLGRAWGRDAASMSGNGRVDGARLQAIREGRPVRLERDSAGPLLFLPDGSALGNGVDPLTGRLSDAAQ